MVVLVDEVYGFDDVCWTRWVEVAVGVGVFRDVFRGGGGSSPCPGLLAHKFTSPKIWR